MPRIRHTGGHGSILTAKKAKGTPYVVSVDEYRFTNSAGSTQSQTHTVSVPGGWVKDDLVFSFHYSGWVPGSVDTPAGFRAPLPTNPHFGGSNGSFQYLRAASPGNSILTSSITLTAGASLKILVVVIRAARGVDFVGFEGVTRDANGRTLTMISRAALAEGLVMFLCGNSGIAGTLSTSPSGMTLVNFSGLGINLSIHAMKVKAGDTLNKTLTYSNGSDNGGAVVVLVG